MHVHVRTRHPGEIKEVDASGVQEGTSDAVDNTESTSAATKLEGEVDDESVKDEPSGITSEDLKGLSKNETEEACKAKAKQCGCTDDTQYPTKKSGDFGLTYRCHMGVCCMMKMGKCWRKKTPTLLIETKEQFGGRAIKKLKKYKKVMKLRMKMMKLKAAYKKKKELALAAKKDRAVIQKKLLPAVPDLVKVEPVAGEVEGVTAATCLDAVKERFGMTTDPGEDGEPGMIGVKPTADYPDGQLSLVSSANIPTGCSFNQGTDGGSAVWNSYMSPGGGIPVCTADQKDHSDGNCPIHKRNGGCTNNVKESWWARCPVTCDRCIPEDSPMWGSYVRILQKNAHIEIGSPLAKESKDFVNDISFDSTWEQVDCVKTRFCSDDSFCDDSEVFSTVVDDDGDHNGWGGDADSDPRLIQELGQTIDVLDNVDHVRIVAGEASKGGEVDVSWSNPEKVADWSGNPYKGYPGQSVDNLVNNDPITFWNAANDPNIDLGRPRIGDDQWAVIVDMGIQRSDCLAAAVSQFGSKVKTTKRSYLVTGNWAHLPPGCSVQSGGDWAAHYNDVASSTAPPGAYSLVTAGTSAVKFNSVRVRARGTGGHNPEAITVTECSGGTLATCGSSGFIKTCERAKNEQYQECAFGKESTTRYYKISTDGWGPRKRWQRYINDIQVRQIGVKKYSAKDSYSQMQLDFSGTIGQEDSFK